MRISFVQMRPMRQRLGKRWWGGEAERRMLNVLLNKCFRGMVRVIRKDIIMIDDLRSKTRLEQITEFIGGLANVRELTLFAYYWTLTRVHWLETSENNKCSLARFKPL